MPKNQLLYLSKAEVEAVGVTMAEIVESLEVTFRAKGEGRTEMPPKPSIHPGGGDNFMNAMLAYIPDIESAGVKWVSGFPENPKRGLPYIAGLLIFNDVASGLPLAVMDGVWMTAMRTGAATALSAKYLARPESSVVGVLGCGVQGRSNVEALDVLFPLKEVRAYDVNAESVEHYAADIRTQLDLEVIAVGDRSIKHVIVKSSIKAKDGTSYYVRESTDPSEVGQLYRLFLRQRYPKTVSEHDRFFVVVDALERLVGGLFYVIESERVVHLDGVVIGRPLQNNGLGSALLEDFCMRMSNFGFEVVRTNFYRRNFYLKRSFQTDERWGGLVRFLGTQTDET